MEKAPDVTVGGVAVNERIFTDVSTVKTVLVFTLPLALVAVIV
jgi:hypothetical protein